MTPHDFALVGGSLHFLVLVASAATPKVLRWEEELAKLHPFFRRLFWVYGVFIALTILGFGLISIVLPAEVASGAPLARAFCAFVAIFWVARLFVQFFVFDARPFLTNWFYKAGYHGLTALFLAIVGLYAWLAFW